MSSLDKTFCASHNCKNECGRQMTAEQKQKSISHAYISYAYFCGEPCVKDKQDLYNKLFQ